MTFSCILTSLIVKRLRQNSSSESDSSSDEKWIEMGPQSDEKEKKNFNATRVVARYMDHEFKSHFRQQSRLPGAGPGSELSNGGVHTTIPAPPLVTGHIPGVRLKTEIPNRKMEPPPCVQNAMMKQDKKPFTYTPGGIDLSEIKSPRMARRIERNAAYTGAPESPRSPQIQQNHGPLPPSALAAMQPQLQVQVFPSGPPPSANRGAAPPPPPPPPANIPPPPPLIPLPTQKVITSENQVVERPDMTKIIPDNPMAMLRKTGGPKPRAGLVDEIYNMPQQKQQPAAQRPQYVAAAPPQYSPPPPAQYSPPVQATSKQPSPPRYQPNVIERQPQQQWSPPQPQRYQPNIIERQPPQPQPAQPEVKTSTAHIGSLYIPPLNQPQPKQVQPQWNNNAQTPPTPPQRDPQSPISPGTPTLKEAPKPWQKQKESQELPPWAKREPVSPPEQMVIQQQPSPPPVQNNRVQQPQGRPQQYQQPQQYQPQPDPQQHPNAVYITQPLVLQHPGPRPGQPQQQQRQQPPKVDAQGARVIPVQIEGTNNRNSRASPATPVTPGNDPRALNRQQSWSNNPTQSNSFKLIQKITNTDGDDDDEEEQNQPITEHAPRYPQQFQQQQIPSADQLRKMKLTEGDRDLMNRFRQDEEDPRYRGGVIPSRVFRFLDESGVDDETYLHNEVDPRYRGPAIPSKAFKLLQSMTDGSGSDGAPHSPQVNAAVSRPAAPPSRGPQVRTIPIQIERDEAPKNYVHPSEQTVPEPKKYTGSSIPSRSFKMLQAMTAPDNCANANEANEHYDPSSYPPQWYDPYSYYQDYYYYYPPPTPVPKENEKKSPEKDLRQTPLPYWGYYPPPPSPYPYMHPPMRTPDIDSEPDTARNTPLPYWGMGYSYPYYPPTPTPTKEQEYYDPYYYYYPQPMYPMYPPVPYGINSDSEEIGGYSSTDEMAYYAKKLAEEKKAQRNKTPKIIVTPTLPEEDTTTPTPESDVDEDEAPPNHSLQAIKSVKDISVYDHEDEEDDDDTETNETSTEDNDDSASFQMVDEEVIPHQLSIIFEESEKTRESSIVSDCTTLQSEDEEDEAITGDLQYQIRTSDEEVEDICARQNSDEEVEAICKNRKEDEMVCASATRTFGTSIEIRRCEEMPSRPPSRFEESDARFEEAKSRFEEAKSKFEETRSRFIERAASRPPSRFEEAKAIDEDMKLGEALRSASGIIREIDEITTVSKLEETCLKSRRRLSCCEDEKAELYASFTVQNPTSNVKEEFFVKDNSKQQDDDQIGIQLRKEETEVVRKDECVKRIEKYSLGRREVFLGGEEIVSTDEEIVITRRGTVSDKGKVVVEKQEVEVKRDRMEEKRDFEAVDKISKEKAVIDVDESDVEAPKSGESEESEEDWWGILNKDDDPIVTLKKTLRDDVQAEEIANKDDVLKNNETHLSEDEALEVINQSLSKPSNEIVEETASSASSSDSSSSESEAPDKDESSSDSSESSESETESSEEEEKLSEQKQQDVNNNNDSDSREVSPKSIKDRIEALREAIKQKRSKFNQQGDEEEPKVSVKDKISAIEIQHNKSSTKSSVKSFEDLSEEEGDSGVTSDMSRHISDNEEFPELKKMTRYQRAATHSRLFKLLQEDCEDDDQEQRPVRRNQLSLALKPHEDYPSPLTSPVNEKLAIELVQSMLKRKKGQVFRNVSIEKLQAAAKKILMEDLADDLQSPDSCFLSPLRNNSTESSTPAQTPQEFYNDYKQYYDSFEILQENCEDYGDVLPSKALKMLQEHILAKCPKILLKKSLDTFNSSPPDKPPGEVSSAS